MFIYLILYFSLRWSQNNHRSNLQQYVYDKGSSSFEQIFLTFTFNNIYKTGTTYLLGYKITERAVANVRGCPFDLLCWSIFGSEACYWWPQEPENKDYEWKIFRPTCKIIVVLWSTAKWIFSNLRLIEENYSSCK